MSAGGVRRWFLPALCLVLALLFTALGVWQLERRAWKLDLIERVDARVIAPPQPVPPRGAWGSLDPRKAEYRRVRAMGEFLHDRETLVDALTERGAGAWVLTPLRTLQGTILVNRGFVPPDRRAPKTRAAAQPLGEVTVTGLLRVTEPNGRVLRANRPAENRWYSRDVQAIARARDLGQVAPFFIDADAKANPGGYPVGGLTVISFRNTHLIYALTWFGLAALSVVGLFLLLKPAHKPG
ncbi:SURF1 family protein [uncultured Sphingomonas sp.]|uniref:SURF1 family protein n=1 Tax=uncultured Sphingomonas sp. TaxID=158754 RepID=UPI0025D40A8F|nr:SURF1 family protein [uncultured Sphingomonas sp.]